MPNPSSPHSMEQRQLLRLRRIEVDRLFGLYDHRIDLNLDDRVTILHGPNGVGKTTVLRMVDGLLRHDLAHIRRIPFSRLLLGFHDGSVLQVTADQDMHGQPKSGTLTLRTKDAPALSSTVNLEPSDAESVAAEIDYVQPHDSIPDTWIDVRDGEILSEADVLSRFPAPRQFGTKPRDKDPVWIDRFLKGANTYFIEAQRLVRTPRAPGVHAGLMFPRSRRSFAPASRVEECGLDFQQRLSDTMATYGRKAQTLDQTFPQRLISATEDLAQDALQDRMAKLDEKTEALKSIGVLDETPAYPFDAASLRNMDSTQARVMTLYVQDTDAKLAALDNLAQRARLLLDGVNTKFRNKSIRLDREKGLMAVMENGTPLPLTDLSSGEQHELVLHYHLLFRVQPNTVVLIDEPELSLHVEWQKQFIPDLKRTVELSGFDAVIATHSPYIVGDAHDLMVGLGDSE